MEDDINVIVTLYLPGEPVRYLPSEGFLLPEQVKGRARPTEQVAQGLGCAMKMVDILDSSLDHVVYSIFDCNGEVNPAAMQAAKTLSRYDYDAEEEGNQFRGPVLIVSRG